MTDYFALLAQPRQPWLDSEPLEAKYRELARVAHPNQSLDESGGAGAEINVAYRVLRDPKLRLQHLLMLEGHSPASSAEVPSDLVTLFMKIAPALSSNNREQTDNLLAEVRKARNDALRQIRELNRMWSDRSAALREADKVYRRFSFLTRWHELLEERSFSLAEA